MNWKHVFDTEIGHGKFYGHIGSAARAAWHNGKKFMNFNGTIYFILYRTDKTIETHDTGLRVSSYGRKKREIV